MSRAITAVLVLICFLSVSCASLNQVSKNNDQEKNPPVEDSYRVLEQKLIEDYLAHSNTELIQLDEDEVLIYNTRDELEYKGKAQSTDARILVLKGDFLIDLNHMQIYQINK